MLLLLLAHPSFSGNGPVPPVPKSLNLLLHVLAQEAKVGGPSPEPLISTRVQNSAHNVKALWNRWVDVSTVCWLERPVSFLLWVTSLSFITTDVPYPTLDVCCLSGITTLKHFIYESFSLF